MPQLTFKGISKLAVLNMSEALVDELVAIINAPREYFTLEHVDSFFIKDGQKAPDYPLVFVAWFDRGQDIRDRAAKSITKHVHNAGYKNVDVIFTDLEKSKYYENGEHF